MNSENQENIFEQFGYYYDKMISWEKRVNKEEPFYKELIRENGIKSVLDVGCGTGHHALMFHRFGMEVIGVDPSREMVSAARENSKKEGTNIEFLELGMGSLNSLNRSFDLITCLGNSLAHMRDEDSLRQALQEFYNGLTKSGVLVIQMRNYDKVYSNKERYIPPNSYKDTKQEMLFLRMTDLIAEDQVQFNILIFHREQDKDWNFHVLSEMLTPWRQVQLSDYLQETGYKNILTYGNYQKAPWSPKESPDLIMVAYK